MMTGARGTWNRSWLQTAAGRTLINYGSAGEGDKEEVAGGRESGGKKGEGPKSLGSRVLYFLIQRRGRRRK